MFACSRGGIKMRQPAAAAAVKSTADYSRRMRVHVQQAMAEGNVEAAMTSWRSKEPDMSAYRSAPVHLDEAFASLDVPELSANMGRVRIRQAQHQSAADPPDWNVFADPALPLAIDIGSGNGRFLIAISREVSDMNFLGIDIRRPLIERGNKWAAALGARRVHFHVANATLSLQHMIAGPHPYPGSIELVTILHPDPHFKSKHHKRRVVQPTLVRHLASLLPPGARVVMQSDDADVALAMRTCFEQHGDSSFRLAGESERIACRDWLLGANVARKLPPPIAPLAQLSASAPQQSKQELEWQAPSCLPVPSDREVICRLNGLPIYRTVLVRTQHVV